MAQPLGLEFAGAIYLSNIVVLETNRNLWVGPAQDIDSPIYVCTTSAV
jgi:hypothetical protein